jgi:hypothetical protein
LATLGPGQALSEISDLPLGAGNTSELGQAEDPQHGGPRVPATAAAAPVADRGQAVQQTGPLG